MSLDRESATASPQVPSTQNALNWPFTLMHTDPSNRFPFQRHSPIPLPYTQREPPHTTTTWMHNHTHFALAITLHSVYFWASDEFK